MPGFTDLPDAVHNEIARCLGGPEAAAVGRLSSWLRNPYDAGVTGIGVRRPPPDPAALAVLLQRRAFPSLQALTILDPRAIPAVAAAIGGGLLPGGHTGDGCGRDVLGGGMEAAWWGGPALFAALGLARRNLCRVPCSDGGGDRRATDKATCRVQVKNRREGGKDE